jgi:arsenical pump membrane protein
MPAHILLVVVVAISILLMLVRPRNIPEVYWVGAGALLLVLLRLIPARLAGNAIAKGSDVYLFLTGMMLLSELAREHGVFEWVSSAAVKHARGSAARLFMLIYGVGILVTVCLSNDATAVVLTPAVLAAVRKSKVQPLPYLFVCAMIANAASFVLPISNPANLVVFHEGMPPLASWLLSFGAPSVLSIAATYAVLRWRFRRELRGPVEESTEVRKLGADGKLVLAGLLLVVAVLLAASALNRNLGLPTCVAALVTVAVLSIRSRSNPLILAREVSWSTLALVAALFVLVDAVESVGALRGSTAAMHWAQALPTALGALTTSFTLGIGSNLVNNLPLGLVAGATVHGAHVHGLLSHAVLIGVDLGPNLSVTGSLATVLWLLALRRESINVSFLDFFKVGALAMPAALLVSVGSAIALQLVMH